MDKLSQTLILISLYTTELRSAIKEGARLALIGAISYLLTEGVLLALVDSLFGVKIDPTMRLIFVGAVASALRAIDKALHEIGKTNENKVLSRGITQF